MPKSHSVVKVGRTSVGAACTAAAAVRSFFVATAFLATALRFFFAAFLPADFNFRTRIVFFVAALRFGGMGIFLSASNMWHRPYTLYLPGHQGSDCADGNNSFDAAADWSNLAFPRVFLKC
jgi:hypothetical protein